MGHNGCLHDPPPADAARAGSLAALETPAGSYDGTPRNLADGYHLWLRLIDGVMTWESGCNTTVITEAAMEWIEARTAEQSPWFAYVAYNAAHLPEESAASFSTA